MVGGFVVGLWMVLLLRIDERVLTVGVALGVLLGVQCVTMINDETSWLILGPTGRLLVPRVGSSSLNVLVLGTFVDLVSLHEGQLVAELLVRIDSL